MNNPTVFAPDRALDVICLGRLAVDLYAQQVGARLEEVSSFAKYLGGSSGNIAFGCARLGLKSAMLTRVGDDHMGRFLVETLAREGCDVSHVRTDRERLTALVLLGLKDRDTFPLVFHRENCADMAVDVGGPGTLNETLRAVRHGGRISLMGVLTGFDGPVNTAAILSKRITLQGIYVGSVEMLHALVQAAPKPVVDQVFAFGEAEAAYSVLAGAGHFGKLVIRVA